jgi:hypothetical protein
MRVSTKCPVSVSLEEGFSQFLVLGVAEGIKKQEQRDVVCITVMVRCRGDGRISGLLAELRRIWYFIYRAITKWSFCQYEFLGVVFVLVWYVDILGECPLESRS